ncbi:hypothetical protein SAY86_003795 [Trapa natans]|uniref:Uncharacterized protein n=1 Tax=Trapa natans TaxID=22666 RepID=A0AAN7N4Y6_TRANT|nr:hypothetical protein SAY86_003795 [Trapa natans]
MEGPTRLPQALSPCSSGRSRLSIDSNSPEFEFWRLQDSSFPQPDLLSADELFSGGILLPLSHLSLPQIDRHPDTEPPSRPDLEPPSAEPSREEDKRSEEARVVAEADPPTVSKRWRGIFRKQEKKREEGKDRTEKKKEKRGQGGSGSPELNINIWPFSRSRSAGTGGSRPRTSVAAARKVSSAPCSRSNSAGESKFRKWPSSPSRGGVHLGRSSPVWQVKRTSLGGIKSSDLSQRSTASNEDTADIVAPRWNRAAGSGFGRRGGRTGGGAGTTKTRVLNLNVPMCMGYRQHLSCKGGDSNAIGVSSSIGSGSGGGGAAPALTVGGGNGNLFNLRSLFTRKVH